MCREGIRSVARDIGKLVRAEMDGVALTLPGVKGNNCESEAEQLGSWMDVVWMVGAREALRLWLVSMPGRW